MNDRTGVSLKQWNEQQHKPSGSARPPRFIAELDEKTWQANDLSPLGEWDAGDDVAAIPPRGWLFGVIFCRMFVSMLVAAGGVGKTALRYAQYISMAAGRSLTGDHLFQRCRVLVISLEDSPDELRRRTRAACLHHGISASELKGWLFLAAPGRAAGKIAIADERGKLAVSTLAQTIEKVIIARKIDLVAIDPFVKAHAAEENSNDAIDYVMSVLTDLAVKHDIAVDTPHHIRKGGTEPGNADNGRGASAGKDAGRLVYTLTPMTSDEAKAFGVSEKERRHLIRMDSAKVNIAPPLDVARWFRLVGVKLGNETALYPNGDDVQTIEPWTPPDTWDKLSSHLLNAILTDIDAGLADGNRYSDGPNVIDRAAWPIILKHSPGKPEKQARDIIKMWVKNGVLVRYEYDNPKTRKSVSGLRVDDTKRPS